MCIRDREKVGNREGGAGERWEGKKEEEKKEGRDRVRDGKGGKKEKRGEGGKGGPLLKILNTPLHVHRKQ